ncbi:DUF805 domain-containing protein [Sandaracinobacter neustonicus]|uniref:DUF805 domain-containing protein n=1 Tax=Sandaracinobacter neustonicus TaxID=1715348 RepID=A0A501XW35_9SPHN|nr:DUF805 domain-containing protein [Sandaracinobacter neustonicus]TPE64790.1 DUF805 domain-containing protein [Sandaracinobacter neustonicus]
MSLMFQPLRKYATFSGRARRKEYWLWQLFVALLYTALTIWLVSTLGPIPETATADEMMAQMNGAPAAMYPMIAIGLASLLLFLPSLAVTVRRIHDSGNSGWWILLGLTAVGGIVILVFALIDGTPGPNRYGADPKGRAAPAY